MYVHINTPTYLFMYFILHRKANTILRSFGVEDGNFGMNIFIMILQLSAFRVLTYIMLKRKLGV